MTAVKGVAMGAADVIPGVSGGTIAFMTGIYDKLIHSISSINMTSMKMLFKGQFKEFWKYINGTFLLCLASGILVSILSLANLMQYLLGTHPIQTWAFFFGLIVASSIFILKGIEGWKAKDAVVLVCGIALGVLVCTLSPTNTPDALWFIFLSGAIAICAMILPGISGSFILLILGKYKYMMSTIAGLTSGSFWESFGTLAVFGVGALIGLLSFAKFLNWLLGKYHKATLLALAGFIIGSLVKVWPWNDMQAIAISQHPEILKAPEALQAPAAEIFFSSLDLQIPSAICFALIGFLLVTGIEWGSKRLSKTK